MGGMVAAIERGYPQREIAESAYRFQQDVERGRQVIVAVNDFVTPQGNGEATVPILQIDEDVAAHQLGKTAALRRARSQDNVQAALTALREAASGTANTMPALLEAVRAYATIGEMCDVLRQAFGVYQETVVV